MSIPDFSVLLREHTIDQILVEEFLVSPTFTNWAIRTAIPELRDEYTVLAVNQSVVQDGRETDVEVLIDAGRGRRVLVFVENKITAPMQPFQLEDYQARGRRNVRRGRCSNFAVVLCAPAEKIRQSESVHVDGNLSYEALRDYFRAAGDARSDFRAEVFARGIHKHKGDAVSDADTDVSDFWTQYVAAAAQTRHKFISSPPATTGGRPSGSDIIYLRSQSLPANVLVPHKWKRSEVELQFPKLGEYRNAARLDLQAILPIGARVEKSGASLAIRITVPRVLPWDPFEEQEAAVLSSLAAADSLVDWFLANQPAWGEFVASRTV